MIAAGKLRKRLSVLGVPTTPILNGFGEPDLTPVVLGTRWASVEPLSGRELWQAQQVRPDVSHKITMRFYAGLTPRHKLRFTDPQTSTIRTFEIDSVLNVDERNRVMTILAKEEVA